MGSRRRGRALALQLLYQLDARDALGEGGRDVDIGAELRQQRACFDEALSRLAGPTGPGGEEAAQFAEALGRGVVSALARIDAAIESAAQNWRLVRMDLVDRNVLRLATWELMQGDVPAGAVINEAVELAKQYGSGKSGGFVNGVLDKVSRSL